AVLVCGGSFSALQFLTSNYHGPTLVDVVGGVGSLVATAVFLRFWQPRDVWRYPADENAATPPVEEPPPSTAQAVYAWTPWALLSVLVFLWGWPAYKTALDGGSTGPKTPFHQAAKFSLPVPELHNVVYRTAPVAPTVVPAEGGAPRAAQPEKAVFDFNWLSATGTGIFVAAVLSAGWLRIGPQAFVSIFGGTLFAMRWALTTIALMLALAFVTKYGGGDATLGLAFTRTGWWYPFFAPLLGWLGVALTGSDTSSNALFGGLQKVTAEQLGLNPTLIVASNSTGGVMGKMVDAQSIVVAGVATGRVGDEGAILRYVLPHSIALAVLMGLVTMAQAYLFPWMIPTAGP
ncbi:MAG: L-lactate permease, partial [Planctomycetia bacterium]